MDLDCSTGFKTHQAVLDRVFYKRLNGQCRKNKLCRFDFICNAHIREANFFDIDVILDMFQFLRKPDRSHAVELAEISSQIQTEITHQLICFLGIFQAHTLYGAEGVVNEVRLDLGKHNRNAAFL